jgi:hypothetical protein
MRRATLRLEALDGRVVPSVVSGDVAAVHRGDYLMGSPLPSGGEVVTMAGIGSKPGATGDGVTPFGGRVITGDV